MNINNNNWTACGTKINEDIKIKISDQELGTECVTKAKVFVVGEETIWNTDDLLSDCTILKIDPVNSRLQSMLIKGADEMTDCINLMNLNVVLEDYTIYKKEPDSFELKKST